MADRKLAEDVAYVRTLAEEGRNAPLVGGPFLVFLGIVLVCAYLLHWALLTEAFGRQHGLWFAVLWIGFGAIACAGVLLARKGAHTAPGASSIANRVDRAVWLGVVRALTAVIAGCIGRAMTLGDAHVINAIMAAAFGLYGVALGATGVISGRTWLNVFASLSFGTSAFLWMFGSESWAYLWAAAATFVVLAVPGFIMMRRDPAPSARV